jgi:hypothetical protein
MSLNFQGKDVADAVAHVIFVAQRFGQSGQSSVGRTNA